MHRQTLLNGAIELHSQPATRQDEWVIKHTHGLKGGYFIECGINDGLRHSNTLALEQSFGWTGLLVEADPYLSDQAQENRPACQHATRALSVTTDSTVQFTRGGQWGGLTAFLPDAWRREHEHRRAPIIWVTTITLCDLLRQYKAPETIDYFSLDIEGAEVPVLEDYFHHPMHRFRCLTVEYREDAGELMRLRRILEPHGYILDRTRAWDAFFYHESLTRFGDRS
jgi:FkbM family methyltransferase